MTSFINDISNAVTSGGKPKLRNCLTLYFFGERKLINVQGKTDTELNSIVDNCTDSIMDSFNKGGMPLVEITVNNLKSLYS